MVGIARAWAAQWPRRELATLMRDRNYRPLPVAPVGAPVAVHAASADRSGVWLLDTGGSAHFCPWSQIDQCPGPSNPPTPS